MNRAHWRDHVVTTVVAFITAVYGVALVQGAQLVSDLMPDDGAAGMTVLVTALVFIALGAYSAAVVTANSFSTIIAGRLRQIAQLRLLGATANRLRAALTAEGLVAGVLGSVLGVVAGLGAYALVVRAGIDSGNLPDMAYTMFSWRTVLPAFIVIVTVVVAAWSGTRSIARVAPVQALSANVEAPVDARTTPIAQRVLAIIALAGGGLLLAAGAAVGAVTPLGLPIAFLGGMLSFTGVVIGARMFVPGLLRLVGRAFGDGVPARLAVSNAVRSPRAATRGVIGMVVGVTLTTMFVVAIAITRDIVLAYSQAMASESGEPMIAEMFNTMLDVLTWIAVALVGVSAVIGATGMVSNLSLGVLQRQRELGLLRAVGGTAAHVRASIALEAVITSVVAVGAGFVLGLAYGWIGAQSTLGAVAGGVVPLVVPSWLLATIAAATVALAAITAVGPALRATRVTPIRALAVE